MMRLYLSRKEQYAIAILLLAALGAILVLSYAYGQRARQAKTPPFLETAAPETPVTPPAPTAEQLTVHVTGAVVKPGLYTFPAGSRIHDAIEKAGGATTDGVPDALNLAAKLRDGDKLYIPTTAEWAKTKAEQGTPPLVQSDPSNTTPRDPEATDTTATDDAGAQQAQATHADTPERKALPTGKISLNTATKEQLMTLPGIGESTAQRILDYRTAHGNFTDLAQLLDVPRIGAKTLERLQPYLTL